MAPAVQNLRVSRLGGYLEYGALSLAPPWATTIRAEGICHDWRVCFPETSSTEGIVCSTYVGQERRRWVDNVRKLSGV